MYLSLIVSHSLVRWLVAVSLLYAVFRGLRGWINRSPFTKADDTVRHVTATIVHIQFTIGWVLYFTSPFVAYFRSHFKEAVKQPDLLFFGMIHITLMTIAVFVISIGSSLAKRREGDATKFKTMTIFYLIGILIILIAIPWPFSPLSARPWLRTF